MIETERLVLTKPAERDLAELCALWADPKVTEHITPEGKPMERRQAWSYAVFLAGHWQLYGFGPWIVRERSGGAFVGQVGYTKYLRGFDTAREHLPEIGWALAPSRWGQGFALEAARAAIGWGDAHLPDPETMAITAASNQRSQRLLSKLGYVELERVEYRNTPAIVYHRNRLPTAPSS